MIIFQTISKAQTMSTGGDVTSHNST